MEMIKKILFSFKSFVFYVLVISVTGCFLFSSKANKMEKQVQVLNNDLTKQEEVLQKKEAELDLLQKKNATLNIFIESANIKELMEKNIELEKISNETNSENLFFTNKSNNLENKIKQIQKENYNKIKELENKIHSILVEDENKCKKLESILKEKQDELIKYKLECFIFDKKKQYKYKGLNITNFIIRMKLIKFLCNLSYEDINFKEVLYKKSLKDLKQVMKEDKYIKTLKFIKVYKEPDLVQKVLKKYLSSENKLRTHAIESNNKISEHLTEIIAYFDSFYLVK
jgi:hypothetical protein